MNDYQSIWTEKPFMCPDDDDFDMMSYFMKPKTKMMKYDDMDEMCDYMYQSPHQKMVQPPYYKMFDTTKQLNQALINQVNECALTCHRMINMLVDMDCDKRRRQIRLLHDCARVCTQQTIYLVTNSMFSKQHASLCAIICETCGKECARFSDPQSQHCARICLECAKACFEYARM